VTYQIADEPTEGALRDHVVHPNTPLLAMMVAGAWLSWPWFAFNAIALGSPTRRKELALCGAALGGTVVLGAIAIELFRAGLLPEGAPLRLAVLAILTFKLAISYAIASVQERTFFVYEYYGGTVRSAGWILAGGFLLRGTVLTLIEHPLWVIIVAGGIPGGIGG
jgi:hypothetical protein